MNRIEIEGMEFFAYHGHYDEEKITGNRFLVDLAMDCDLLPAAVSDNLQDTVNYQAVYQLIKKEMEIPSHLLENIAYRILNSIFDHFRGLKLVRIKISKMNPPMGGKIDKVSVVMEKKS